MKDIFWNEIMRVRFQMHLRLSSSSVGNVSMVFCLHAKAISIETIYSYPCLWSTWPLRNSVGFIWRVFIYYLGSVLSKSNTISWAISLETLVRLAWNEKDSIMSQQCDLVLWPHPWSWFWNFQGQILNYLYRGNRCSAPWWRHQMETFSTLLALRAGNSPVTDMEQEMSNERNRRFLKLK